MLETSPMASPEGKDFGCLITNRDGGDLFDLNPKEVIRLFKKHGALLFRGYRLDGGEGFSAFTDIYGREFISYPTERRVPVTADATVQTAVKGEGGITLHQEMSYLPYPFCPDIVLFYCEQPPLINGQTIVCDGTAVVPRVSKQAQKLLNSQPLKYEMEFTVEQCMTFLRAGSLRKFRQLVKDYGLSDMFKVSKGMVRSTYLTPAYTLTKFGRKRALMKPLNNKGRELSLPVFADGSRLPDDLYDELEGITDSLTVDINWQPGDLLMFDNSRIMHGRRTVDDNQRLLFTRFGKNNFV